MADFLLAQILERTVGEAVAAEKHNTQRMWNQDPFPSPFVHTHTYTLTCTHTHSHTPNVSYILRTTQSSSQALRHTHAQTFSISTNI